jgi:hypothetical protein
MSNPFVPLPQLGPDLTSVIIYGLNVGAGGALTTGTTVVVGAVPPNVQNVIRKVNVTNSPGHQEINAMNTRQRNQVIIDDGLTLDLTIYNVNNGRDPSPLTTLWLNYDYFFVEWIEGTVTGAIYTNEFYGCRGDLDKPFEGRGEQMTNAHFLEMDPGFPTIPQYNRFLSG